MRRRAAKAGGKAIKTQRRKALRRRNAVKVARRQQAFRRQCNRKDCTAHTWAGRGAGRSRRLPLRRSEILLKFTGRFWRLFFQTILANATRLCEAKFGEIFRFDGAVFCFAARVNTPPDYAEFQSRRGPSQPYPGGGLDQMMTD